MAFRHPLRCPPRLRPGPWRAARPRGTPRDGSKKVRGRLPAGRSRRPAPLCVRSRASRREEAVPASGIRSSTTPRERRPGAMLRPRRRCSAPTRECPAVPGRQSRPVRHLAGARGTTRRPIPLVPDRARLRGRLGEQRMGRPWRVFLAVGGPRGPLGCVPWNLPNALEQGREDRRRRTDRKKLSGRTVQTHDVPRDGRPAGLRPGATASLSVPRWGRWLAGHGPGPQPDSGTEAPTPSSSARVTSGARRPASPPRGSLSARIHPGP